MGLPKIAILICSFNESKTLAKVVRDASKFGKVLVINDGSTDNTKEMIKKFKVFKINNTVGTVVVRWEYSLGSTIYLVYNINDSNYYSSDEKKWTGSGTNTVFLKLNYWFQP